MPPYTNCYSARRLIVAGVILAGPAAASPFGTVNEPLILNQHCEHEMITRVAFQCPAGTPSNGDCFEPASLDQLAGTHSFIVGLGDFGAVGAPDAGIPEDAEAHCDNADYLGVAGYPQSRAEATDQLQLCVEHLRLRFWQGWQAAPRLLNTNNQILANMVDLDDDCDFDFEGDGVNNQGRAKCNVIEGLGRALHGVQDFYSHSNWADHPNPNEPIGIDNPPGLGQAGLAPFLDLRNNGSIASGVPLNLSTGCFSLNPFGGCSDRITHGALNKDHGIINLDGTFGEVGQGTDRGQVPGNFQLAVDAAIRDSRRQWTNLRARLLQEYGQVRSNRMICAIVRDNPVTGCT